MAKTKKSMQIQADKQALREQIGQLNETIRRAASQVPARVRRGSHQEAVAWKDLAKKAMGIYDCGPSRATLRRLQGVLASRRATLGQLQ